MSEGMNDREGDYSCERKRGRLLMRGSGMRGGLHKGILLLKIFASTKS